MNTVINVISERLVNKENIPNEYGAARPGFEAQASLRERDQSYLRHHWTTLTFTIFDSHLNRFAKLPYLIILFRNKYFDKKMNVPKLLVFSE